MARKAVIVGGGLAGMVVAKELCKRGIQVVILEATESMGGKAGGKARKGNVLVEHGYHVFPFWYRNTRQLFCELNIEQNFINVHKSHYLKKKFRKEEVPHFATFYELSSLRNWYRTLFSGIRPWPEMILSYYAYLDLASRCFKDREFLDRLSVSGFLYKRVYTTEGVIEFNQHQTLQATSTPIYEMSVMTLRNVVRLWVKYRKPFLSILNGNLQEKFINPFTQQLQQRGVDMHYKKAVKKLTITNQRISGVKFTDGSPFEGTSTDDIFVLATPPEVTFQFYDDEVAAAEQAPSARSEERSLSYLANLRSMPMAGLTLYFNRRIPELPPEHVLLDGSSSKISFIDISQQWDDLEAEHGNTVLSLIAADFAPLKALSPTAMAEHLMAELVTHLQAYVPTIHRRDIARYYLEPNLNSPLFLNTAGAWHYRPGTRTRIGNLYISGDYCRTAADLTTMESAVLSGLSTAQAILTDQGIKADVEILPLKTHPTFLYMAGKWLLFPFIILLRLLVHLKLVPQTSPQ
jgi:uncharacterized protein with NAD-binding domain and iron-sulfur cluster